MTMAEPYTCGSCRYGCDPKSGGFCGLHGHGASNRYVYLRSGRCPRWLPPRDAWKSETCGSCDFWGKNTRGCYRAPSRAELGSGPYVPRGAGDMACAEWMPRVTSDEAKETRR